MNNVVVLTDISVLFGRVVDHILVAYIFLPTNCLFFGNGKAVVAADGSLNVRTGTAECDRALVKGQRFYLLLQHCKHLICSKTRISGTWTVEQKESVFN